MPRPPTRHGLEKKFKPWRKGKSTKNQAPGATGGSKSRASLKNTLRSQKRLLHKLPADGDTATRTKVEATIAQLEEEIAAKQQTQKERRNAEKYHQVRFFDRQRLTRMERTTRRHLEEATSAAAVEEATQLQAELDDIIRDKLYVAFFPNDTKYFSLFRGGERVVDDEPTAQRRQMIRNRIAEEYKDGKLSSKSWFNLEEIEAMKSPLAAASGPSAGKRKRSYGTGTKTVDKAAKKKVASGKKEDDDPDDDAARNVKASKEGENKTNNSTSDSDDSSSSNSSSDDDSDSDDDDEQNETKVVSKQKEKDDVEEIGNSDSDSDSSSSSSDSDSTSSSDSDSSSSSSDSESDCHDKTHQASNKNANQAPKAEPQQTLPAANEESDDDFFAADDGGNDVFDKAAQYSTGYEYEDAKGDKSRGWASQKQRPGQWKNNRNRRY
mmetsp:Transcript_25037/g.72425  ORF Transcript_25037/g.72425 Transcript_25037/m.72425 type:complete len:437 (+) Transcript_25037:26-1336(+)